MAILSNFENENSEHDFKVINLKYEYPGYKGNVCWAIVSELTEEELLAKYPNEMNKYLPFICLSLSQGKILEEGTKYENKCKMRTIRYHHGFDITDDDFENYHHELIGNDIEDEMIRREDAKIIQNALNSLKQTQKERLYKHFFCQMSYVEIAEDEGVSYTAVRLSIEKAKKNLKKFFGNTFR
ncbi:MAG: sigma-70 family RNA polymerase sigma factor [Acutalibacteraceae bacterium]|nr:sigma-70 family RNA polymerase sigma factor [Acutalibacteraceae bacterium]